MLPLSLNPAAETERTSLFISFCFSNSRPQQEADTLGSHQRALRCFAASLMCERLMDLPADPPPVPAPPRPPSNTQLPSPILHSCLPAGLCPNLLTVSYETKLAGSAPRFLCASDWQTPAFHLSCLHLLFLSCITPLPPGPVRLHIDCCVYGGAKWSLEPPW